MTKKEDMGRKGREEKEEVGLGRKKKDEEPEMTRKSSIKSKYSKMSDADLYGYSCPRQAHIFSAVALNNLCTGTCSRT